MHYILDEKNNVVPTDARTWGKWFSRYNRRVAISQFDGVTVSTVFLGLDHSTGEGPPLVFETMIFGGKHDGYQIMSSTWDEALAAHCEAVALARGAIA